jgi:hypothetical protein
VTYDYTYTGNYGASALAYTINQNSAGLSATSVNDIARIDTPTYDTTVTLSNTTAMTAGDLEGVSVSEWQAQTDPVDDWTTLVALLALTVLIVIISTVIYFIRRLM